MFYTFILLFFFVLIEFPSRQATDFGHLDVSHSIYYSSFMLVGAQKYIEFIKKQQLQTSWKGGPLWFRLTREISGVRQVSGARLEGPAEGSLRMKFYNVFKVINFILQPK